MKKFIILVSIVLIAWSFTVFAQDKITEPSTKVTFPVQRTFLDKDGASAMTCIGTGVRKKFVVKVYGICFYVALDEVRALFPDGFTADDAHFEKLLSGTYHRAFIMRFVRGVGKDKIVGAFRDGLKKNWPAGSKFDPNNEAVKAFLDANNFDIEKNQEIQIWIDNENTVYVINGTHPVQSVQDETLAQAVTGIWLGKKPVSGKMKKGLVSRLPGLLKKTE